MSNKVPQVTLLFWLIKMMSTTVGETAADYLIFRRHLGLGPTSLIMGAALAGALLLQMRARRYVVWRYWLAVVLVSIFGTLVTDNLTDHVHVPLALSTALFSVLLLATFAAWYRVEGTLSIYAIDTSRRERFYWVAILVTFALGTAAGDWVSEGMAIGYAASALIFAALIAATGIAHFVWRLGPVTSFWIAYVLTRPLGASFGDLLARSPRHGGLGLGTTATSVAFLSFILAGVVWLSLQQQRIRRAGVCNASRA